jgi:uncharacterized protein (DUF302 family)
MMPGMNDGIVRLKNTQSADEVVKLLLSLLLKREVTVFAVIDHSGEAAKVGIEMPNTKLVIFGNPRAGTPVMISAPDSALDLPLKILIAEGPTGVTHVSYNDPGYLQSRYGLAPELLPGIEGIRQIAALIAI